RMAGECPMIPSPRNDGGPAMARRIQGSTGGYAGKGDRRCASRGQPAPLASAEGTSCPTMSRPAPGGQAEDVRTDLRRVAVPFGLPVAVDLPARAGQGVPVLGAPAVDRVVGLVQAVVGAEVGRGGHQAGWGGGAEDLAVPGERGRDLGP